MTDVLTPDVLAWLWPALASTAGTLAACLLALSLVMWRRQR